MNKAWLRSGMIGIWLLLISVQSPLFLTFDSLDQANDQEIPRVIQIRGFLYRTPSQLVVLAAHPNLKSCCIGTTSKVSEQIFVRGDISKEGVTHQAVTLQGVLKREPLFDDRGELTQLYVLEQAILLSSKAFPLWTIAIFSLVLVLVVWARYGMGFFRH